MANVVRIERTGEPDVMQWVEVPTPVPGPGEVLIRQTAVGLNFVDTYLRGGLYPLSLPAVLGSEAAGIVAALGPGVTGFKPGERVAYQGVPGAYADERLVPAEKLVKLPDNIDEKTAAASFLKGVTAHFLLRRTYNVGKGTTILFHAAAGGVGQILCQWAAALGATVIGTVGSDDKMELARQNGCAHVINYSRENFAERVKEITGGAGVDVAYDAIGKDTFPATLDCIRPIGLWVPFGQASGPIPPFSPLLLMQKGSLFMTRPTTAHYVVKRSELETAARELFEVIGNGSVKIAIGQTFPLKDAAAAHRALSARQTTGATVLIP